MSSKHTKAARKAAFRLNANPAADSIRRTMREYRSARGPKSVVTVGCITAWSWADVLTVTR